MKVPDVRFARTPEGRSIAFQAGEPGSRDIVFLPFISGLDPMWDYPTFRLVLDRLGRLGRLICLDYRGMGASDPVPLGGVPTPETWMEDLRCVLDAVGSDEAHVVANSSAGFMGMMFAATYPERTSSLVLVDAFARMAAGDGQSFGPSLAEVELIVSELESTWGTGASAVVAPSVAGDLTFMRWSGRFERYTMSRAAFGALVRWNWTLDVRSVIPAIKVPTLIIHSCEGRVLKHEHARWLADTIEGSRLVEIPGDAGQFVFEERRANEVIDKAEEFITGAPPTRETDRALATVMFTDIVDSTAHAISAGDRAWAQRLDDHDTMVRDQLTHYRGREVKTTGDGFVATFDGPARAIQCARAIRDGARRLGMEVRVGLHTGEIELRGNDIGGVAVHIGARVSALAQVGEVLVSRTVTDLVAGSGIEFTGRGDHELKGVPGTWSLFAVQN